MSQGSIHDLNPEHLREEADERIDALRRTARRWRKAGRGEVERLTHELEQGAVRMGARARARPGETAVVLVGGAALAALAGWMAWRGRRTEA